jgi:hypothetical protein
MQGQLTDRSKHVMNLAEKTARDLGHAFVGTEHVLLGLSKEGSGVARYVLDKLGASGDRIRQQLDKSMAGPDPGRPLMGKLPVTPLVETMLSNAAIEAKNISDNRVGTEHLLVALAAIEDSKAAKALHNLGLSSDKIREEVMTIIGFQDRGRASVLQSWVERLTYMQQSVLLTAIRGPDGITKNHVSKVLLRWYRRCILLSAFEGRILETPYEAGGGSFTGPCTYPNSWWPSKTINGYESGIDMAFYDYMRELDLVPHHFQLHFLHAAEILGYKHPDLQIRGWWINVYLKLVSDMHLLPESEEEMDRRLGDNEQAWRSREVVTAD